MSSTTRTQRPCDHRLRELVQITGDLQLAVQSGVPRSTARGWLTGANREVVSLDVLEWDTMPPQHEVMRLRLLSADLVETIDDAYKAKSAELKAEAGNLGDVDPTRGEQGDHALRLDKKGR